MKQLILFLTLSIASFAQTASDAPATRDDILKLFDTMNIREQMRFVMDSVSTQQRTMLHDTLKKRFPNISDAEIARLDQFTSETMKELPVDGMLDDMIPVYQKHLNKADVEAMSAFYASPTGQKMLREMPAMTAEAMQATSPRIQAMMEKVMDRAEQLAREERQKKKAPSVPESLKN